MSEQPGLRERKKQKTRWAIQEHAVRLFAEQGYDATTVEQIAAAAEVSPSTFFRYFKTKEDVVIEDDYDPMIVAAVVGAPPELAPIAAIRHGLAAAFGQLGPAERQQIRERTRLILAVPALRARTADQLTGSISLLTGPLAQRTGRDPDDFELRVFAGACMGAWIAVLEDWATGDTDEDLAALMDRALAAIENGFGF
jgi:AcrR family transcriptional regulator